MSIYSSMREAALSSEKGFAGINYQDPSSLRYALFRATKRTRSPLLVQFEKKMLALLTIVEHVLGLDLSHWNGDLLPAFWSDAYAAGFRFVFLKATEGIGFVDDRFEQNLARAKDAGFLAWGYHYARPQYHGAEQADHFVSVAGDGVIGCAWDLEETGGVSDARINTASELFLSVINAAYDHSWMYSAAWYLDAHRGVNPAVPYLRWPAHWNLYVSQPYLPAIWRADGRWDCWQYWAQGSVSRVYPLDLNRMPIEVFNRFAPSTPCDIDQEAIIAFADRLDTMSDELSGMATELRTIGGGP